MSLSASIQVGRFAGQIDLQRLYLGMLSDLFLGGWFNFSFVDVFAEIITKCVGIALKFA